MNRKPKKICQCALLILFLHILIMNMLPAQNTNYPVGAIPGAIDVSPMGAATYTIPIEVVPGTQGMQPNLSIVYNSFGGMGLLGMKWNLAGLSAITRCGQTPYYDENIEGISFSFAKQFTIDGERLFKISNDPLNTVVEYATEMENFMRITAHHTMSNFVSSPAYFTAYTDDGTIIEYGNTYDSKQNFGSTNNTILSWYINKITDANGNYMTFEYMKDGNEIVIGNIKYTGNGFQPYAKVQFSYTTLPDTLGKNTYFVGGYAIPQTKLLDTITVFYGSAIVRKYHFSYNATDAGERTTHLKEIVLYGEGGREQLNSTTMKWGEQNNIIEIRNLNPSLNGKILTGDFNGDGYTDYVIYDINPNTNPNTIKWRLYLYYPEYNSYVPSSIFDYDGYDMYFAYDINGDGKDELIVGKKEEEWHNFEIFSIYPAIKRVGLINFIWNFRSIRFGDFDGDGATDILLNTAEYKILGPDPWTLKFFKCNRLSWDDLQYMGTISNIKSDEVNIVVMDANGNGKKNIQVKNEKDNTTTIYEFDGTNFQPIFDNTPPTHHSHTWKYYGDINGDGITDVLAYCYNNSLIPYFDWKLFIGKGDGTFFEKTLSSNLLNTDAKYQGSYSGPKYEPFFIDLNGDGKDDIVQAVYNSSSKETTFNIFFSKGWVNGTYNYSKDKIAVPGKYDFREFWHFGDFNGDGKFGILLKDTIKTDKPKIIYFNKNEKYEFVTEIEDGIGKKIELKYKYKYFIATWLYPYSQFTNFTLYQKYLLPLIDSVCVSNGLNGGINTFQYQFNSPAFSLTRRIFLGFKEFVSINNIENRKDYRFSDFVVSKQMLKPTKQTNLFGSKKASETFYTYSIKDLPKGRFTPYLEIIEVKDSLSNSKTITTNTLNVVGRDSITNVQTYNSTNAPANSWFHTETKTFTYSTIILSGSQKKTVPTQVVTTQQYQNSTVVLVDTVSYGYYPAASKGRLQWVRTGNKDGTITTSYEYLSPTGVCNKKTLSAPGSTPRTETYTYDNTGRFVTKIKNPDFSNFETNFTHDPKTGNKLSETGINNLITTYLYDNFGQLKQINHPDGTKTETIVNWYSSSSLPNAKYTTTTTTTGMPALIVYYDTLGREVCRKEEGNYFKTIYNAKGQVDKTIGYLAGLTSNETTGIIRNFTYDSFGRKSTEKEVPYTDLTYTYTHREVKVTDNLRKTSSSKNFDALGRITIAQDLGGTITYTYSIITDNGKPRHKTIVNAAGAQTTTISDMWGNRLSIIEPNAGEIKSEYNGLGELTKQTDANGNVTTFEYDLLGRETQKKFTGSGATPMTINYTYDHYDSTNRGRGKLYQTFVNTVLEETLLYDDKSRLCSQTKVIDRVSYEQNYSYNSNGQLYLHTYPGNFAAKYVYDNATGKLSEIRRNGSDALIYKVNSRNKFNETTRCEYGNGVVTDYTYDKYGMLTRINTGKKVNIIAQSDTASIGPVTLDRGNIQIYSYSVDSTILNYRYAYNELGLMNSRSESVVNRSEKFNYDKLDRLIKVIPGTGTAQNFTYYNNGNIDNNSLIGVYNYLSTKPHAVCKIVPINNNTISQNQCDVTYNFFNQPTVIKEGNYIIDLTYSANQQRNKAVMIDGNSYKSTTRHYINKCYEVDKGTYPYPSRYYHYIYGDNGVVAMYFINVDYANGKIVDSMYYIHTDHLGSYCAITNENKQVVLRNRFDAWGNYVVRDYDPSFPLVPLTTRGFTGHEHYPELKIINMNGRLYDPVIGRFFSPDKYVANSSFTQDFNRYSYARNNPLMYTDPDGESIFIAAIGLVVGAAIGIYQGYKIGNAQGARGSDMVPYMFGGALFGLVAGGFAAGVGVAIDGVISVGGFLGGAAVGAGAGATSGAINGLWTSAFAGTNILQSVLQGAAFGMGTGAAMSGIMGGLNALSYGGNFLTGEVTFYDALSEKSNISYQKAKELAGSYRKSDIAKNENIATKTNLKQEFALEEGNLFKLVSTIPPKDVGITSHSEFVFEDLSVANGFVRGVPGKPPYELYLSAKLNSNIIDFRAVAGHEIIHGIINNTHSIFYYKSPEMFGINSEGAASKYSYQVYWNAGMYEKAFSYSLRAAFYKSSWSTYLHY